MLFNSYEYIFAFLPITFFVFFLLNSKRKTIAAKAFLVAASLFFYSWWDVRYLGLLLVSIFFNFSAGTFLSNSRQYKAASKKILLTIAILINLGLLGYFKYADFFIRNFNMLLSTEVPFLHLILPLAISFFTFQQIAYLVDSYRGETTEYNFLNYAIFVSFFPQLIAGPIVHHREMMPQFANARNRVIDYKNVTSGLLVFSLGLFKKVVVADTFAIWATNGFDKAEVLTLFEAWATSLSYSMQLYFDFCGYTDMAIGAALLFNIKLPINFNSPYKATNIQDFWRRWHITLSRFLRDYIYIPLGGNRGGRFRTYQNLMATFLIGGLWHGAGWTFVFWGFLHGIALVVNRMWNMLGLKMNSLIGWIITFNFVNMAWVFFRAKEWSDATKVLKGMLGMSGVALPFSLKNKLIVTPQHGIKFGYVFDNINGDKYTIIWIFTFLLVVTCCKNTVDLCNDLKPSRGTAIFSGLFFAITVLSLNKVSEFLYFNF